MRLLFLLPILAFAVGCTCSRNSSTKNNKLNGTWVPTKQELAGTSIPEGAFANQKLIINDSNYTFIAESADKGVVKYTGDKMDIYGRDGVNAGKHFTAIYKYENGELTICYNLLGSGYPESFETKGKAMYFLSVFKKSP